MPVHVIAIFDIGKTNKKVFLFDEEYKIRFEKSVELAEIKDEDNFPCEDLTSLTQWVTDSFQEILSFQEFEVKALNVSAHGASFVHLGEDGMPVAPLYNYLKPFPENLKKKFYETYGGEDEFGRVTASPVLGHLNSGMQLYWLKQERAEVFQNIKYSLHLPEYISYLFTKKKVLGITSIGCHTNLWDFTRHKYHAWLQQENILEKLAPIASSTEVASIHVDHHQIHVGIGLHDSSAALIPYLSSFTEPFVLLSTGTWCISLNPFNHTPLTEEELKQDCLCYLTYEGNPVKASRLFAGHEHELETKLLSNHFNTAEDHYKSIRYQPELVDQISSREYQKNNLSGYANYDEAYTHFMMHLVKQQATSTRLVLNNTSVKRIFVDGGFSKNSVFMHLLSASFPEIEVYAASVAQATAVGAAMAIHQHWNHLPHKTDIINLNYFHHTNSIRK